MTSSTLALTPDDALSVLEYWHTSAEQLVFVCRRTEECLTRIGCGRVRNATAREAWMETNHGRLHISMHSAAFEFGTLTRDAAECFRETQGDGLLICVDRDDWIFLRSAAAGQSRRPTRTGQRLASVPATEGNCNADMLQGVNDSAPNRVKSNREERLPYGRRPATPTIHRRRTDHPWRGGTLRF